MVVSRASKAPANSAASSPIDSKPLQPSGRHVPHVKKACERCRRNKSKCDGVPGTTCRSCQQVGYECMWTQEKDARRAFTRAYVRALNDRIRLLEDLLRQNGIRFESPSSSPALPTSPVLPGPSSVGPSAPATRPSSASSSQAPSAPEVKAEDSDDLVLQLENQLVLERDPTVRGDLISFYGATSRFPAQYEILRSASPSPSLVSPTSAVAGPSNRVQEDEEREGKEVSRRERKRREGWARNLPWDVALEREEHDRLLKLCFKYFTSWCMRLWPALFWRDFHYISHTHPSPSEPMRTSQYSPLLHNALLALATAYSDNPHLRQPEVRDRFAQRAKECIDEESRKPTLSTIHGISILASYHSGRGEQGLGWMYFGIALRLSYAIGLDLDTSNWVENGPLTEQDNLERDLSCASLVMQDKLWSLYVGRPSGIAPRNINLPQDMPGSLVRDMADQEEVGIASNWYETFRQTWSLTLITFRIMEDIYGSKTHSSSLRNVVSALHLALTNWHDKLPNALRIPHVGTQTIPAHVLSMHLTYEWLTILLLRPFYRRIASARPEDTSVLLCNRAAHQIVRLFSLWRRYHNLRYMTITAVQIAFTAGTTHLLAATYANGAVGKEKGLEGVRECIRCLQEMGQSWQSAIQSSRTLEKMMDDYAGRRETDRPGSPVYLGPAGKYPGTGGFQVQLSPSPSASPSAGDSGNGEREDDMQTDRGDTPVRGDEGGYGQYGMSPTISIPDILGQNLHPSAYVGTPTIDPNRAAIWGANPQSPAFNVYFQTLNPPAQQQQSLMSPHGVPPIFPSGQLYPQAGTEWQLSSSHHGNPFAPTDLFETQTGGPDFDDLMY